MLFVLSPEFLVSFFLFPLLDCIHGSKLAGAGSGSFDWCVELSLQFLHDSSHPVLLQVRCFSQDDAEESLVSEMSVKPLDADHGRQELALVRRSSQAEVLELFSFGSLEATKFALDV